MKCLQLIFSLFILTAIACADKPDRPDSVNTTITPTSVNPPAAPAAEPPQNAEGVWHYTCSNGCAGGAGSQGNCAQCGSPLQHNQGYHASANAANPAIQTNTTQVTPPPSTSEPAQNAAGVWHYTCSNGCAGGSGSASACASCGSPLAHNAAYHN